MIKLGSSCGFSMRLAKPQDFFRQQQNLWGGVYNE